MRLRVLARRKRKKDDKIRTEYIRTENPDDFPPQVFFWDVLVAHPKSYFTVSFSTNGLAKYPANALNQALLHLTVRENMRRIAGGVASQKVVEKAR